VGKSPVEPESSSAIALEADAAAITVFQRGAKNREQLKPVKFPDSTEGIRHSFLFCDKLAFVLYVLPGAPATPAEVGTRGDPAQRGWFHQEQELPDAVILSLLNDSHLNFITRCGKRNQDYPAVVSSNPVRAIG
jgi:hypothetical protein